MHLLFVCTGNSCRSVMAEYLARDWLRRAGIDSITVESAGIFALSGMRASEQTKEVLAACGIDCAAHRARVFTPSMAEKADKIFVMEQFQGEEVIMRAPQAAGKVYLLKNFNLGEGERVVDPNIADPVGKPGEVYESCFAEISRAVERVLNGLGVKRP